jgi:branched-chain amino acid transport system substrate-binding protein
MTRDTLLGLSLTTILALAACGGGATSAASSAGAASPAAPSSAAAKPAGPASPGGASSAAAKPAASASAKPAAAGSGAAAAGTGPIKVGLIEPLTGPLSPNGKDGRDGLNLFLESIGSTVAGRKIEVSEADDQGQADVGLSKAKQLVEGNGVKVLMGFVPTPVCYAVANYVQQAHVPMMVTTDCAAQDLTTNPKFASPYVSRYSNNSLAEGDTAADWAYANGYRKAILMTADYAPGLQVSDLFASAFIARGGSVVQEVHPAPGTTDFGPFLAQLSNDADVLAVFEVGVDSLRFGQQYSDYAGGRKLQVLDLTGVQAAANLNQLQGKTAGFVSTSNYIFTSDAPENQKFVKAFRTKYPNRDIAEQNVTGYVGGQVLTAALQKVNGNVEDQAGFLNAIYATKIDTPRGTVSLDDHHDVVQDKYMAQIVKDGNSIGLKVLKTYPNVSQFWDRTPEQLAKLNVGNMKGQWVGMTKDKLGADVLTLPKS